MKQCVYTIKENKQIAEGIWKMVLAGDGTAITAPGQFVDIRLEGHFLRRPISVHDADSDSLTLIYKAIGSGTKDMTHLQAGKELDILAGLGNGFHGTGFGSTPVQKEQCTKPLLIGGGVGVPPLYLLAKRLLETGCSVQVVLGFTRRAEAFCIDEFKALGAKVHIASVDGSIGIKGLVTDALPKPQSYDCFYACGPLSMLKALDKTIPAGIPGQLSFEERMGCGFGACMGCTIAVKGGYKRICKDGPVLAREEILWQD